ncbi:CD209 antigen-like protein B [Crassostrea angulata]|nr:CD209 antigen-like protein B [Crassostrea angulata]
MNLLTEFLFIVMRTKIETMKKLILFQFLYGLFNYCSAQTVYPNVCMDIPTDLNRIVRNIFLEGFIEFKKDIAKITAAQNWKWSDDFKETKNTMNALDEDQQRTINSVTELRRDLSNHVSRTESLVHGNRAMFLEKMTNLSNAIDDREQQFKLMDTEVISLQVKYTDQKDNITDFGDTLKILLREQKWMVSNVSELHGKMQEMRDATSVIHQQVSEQLNHTDDNLKRFFDESLQNVTKEYSENLQNMKQNVTSLFEVVFKQADAAVSLKEEIRKNALMMERLQVEISELKENISLSKDTPSTRVTCPAGWSMFGTSCYTIFHQQLSWMNASMKCLTYGSKLVEIETKAENDFLKSSLIKDEANYWTGGKDDVTEGQWVWVSSGTTFDFLDWNTGEPNDVGGEDCMEISKHRNRKKSWNDKSCKSSLNLICEKF